MDIHYATPRDEQLVLSATDLFDQPPESEWTREFLARDDHHLYLALDRSLPVGFVTGVETLHPDKGTEMFLYELGVAPGCRRRGIGTTLVRQLAALAEERGCYGMWVLTEAEDAPAIATYRAAGGSGPSAVMSIDWRFGPG